MVTIIAHFDKVKLVKHLFATVFSLFSKQNQVRYYQLSQKQAQCPHTPLKRKKEKMLSEKEKRKDIQICLLWWSVCGVKETPMLLRETIKAYAENEQKKMNEDSLSSLPTRK